MNSWYWNQRRMGSLPCYQIFIFAAHATMSKQNACRQTSTVRNQHIGFPEKIHTECRHRSELFFLVLCSNSTKYKTSWHSTSKNRIQTYKCGVLFLMCNTPHNDLYLQPICSLSKWSHIFTSLPANLMCTALVNVYINCAIFLEGHVWTTCLRLLPEHEKAGNWTCNLWLWSISPMP